MHANTYLLNVLLQDQTDKHLCVNLFINRCKRTFSTNLWSFFLHRNKFVEFDMKPVCKKCYEKFPLELKKRLKKLSDAVARKWTHSRCRQDGRGGGQRRVDEMYHKCITSQRAEKRMLCRTGICAFTPCCLSQILHYVVYSICFTLHVLALFSTWNMIPDGLYKNIYVQMCPLSHSTHQITSSITKESGQKTLFKVYVKHICHVFNIF